MTHFYVKMTLGMSQIKEHWLSVTTFLFLFIILLFTGIIFSFLYAFFLTEDLYMTIGYISLGNKMVDSYGLMVEGLR